MPADYREKTVDLFFIRNGKLARQETVGRKAPLGNLFREIKHIYYNGTVPESTITMYDIDEIRIVNSWIFKNQEFGICCFLENKDENTFLKEVEKSIREVTFD
jgi:hypothetical protein